jgi:hypothetical protein
MINMLDLRPLPRNFKILAELDKLLDLPPPMPRESIID